MRSSNKPTSDLSKPSSNASTPSISSPLSQGSPVNSPLSHIRGVGAALYLPSTLEKTIKIKKGYDQLGTSAVKQIKGISLCNRKTRKTKNKKKILLALLAIIVDLLVDRYGQHNMMS